MKRRKRMQKLSRKLMISIMSLAFAVITLGASTFAWFTLSNKADVQQINARVTAGTGIEVSLDDISYKNTITTAEINQKIAQNLGVSYGAEYKSIMDDVTSANGETFKTLVDYSTMSTVEMNDLTPNVAAGWIWFDLYFRSPEENVKVYLLDSSVFTSTGVDWISDAAFTHKSDDSLTASEAVKLYAVNALRLSTEEYQVTENVTKTIKPGYVLGPKDANVFELDPAISFDNERLDNTVKNYGSAAYFDAKYPTTPLIKTLAQLPATILNNTALKNGGTLANSQGKNPISTLAAEYDNPTPYYYGEIRIRIWLEGWDPDMYNAIMGDSLQLTLNFGGSSIVPFAKIPATIDLTTETLVEYDLGLDFTPTVEYTTGSESLVSYAIDNGKITFNRVSPGAAVVMTISETVHGTSKDITINIPAA
jgi:hypothetical protein